MAQKRLRTDEPVESSSSFDSDFDPIHYSWTKTSKWKPNVNSKTVVLPLFLPDEHISAKVRRGEVLQTHMGRGSIDTTVKWYQSLEEPTKKLVEKAGFRAFSERILTKRESRVAVCCLAERWWDSTHTFHIAGREMTLTPLEFHRLTGLRVGGDPILANANHENNLDEMTRLLGPKAAQLTGKKSYALFRGLFKDHPQIEEADQIIMARAYIIYLLGAVLFSNAAQTMHWFWIPFLEDFEECAKLDWGGAALAFLYSNMDAVSRDGISNLCGYWKCWNAWMRMHGLLDGVQSSSRPAIREFLDKLSPDAITWRPWEDDDAPDFTEDDEQAWNLTTTAYMLQGPLARALYFGERVYFQHTPSWANKFPSVPIPWYTYSMDLLVEPNFTKWREGCPAKDRLSLLSKSRYRTYDGFYKSCLMPSLLSDATQIPGPSSSRGAHTAPASSPPTLELPVWRATTYVRPHVTKEVVVPKIAESLGFPLPLSYQQPSREVLTDMYMLVGGLKDLVHSESQRAIQAEARVKQLEDDIAKG